VAISVSAKARLNPMMTIFFTEVHLLIVLDFAHAGLMPGKEFFYFSGKDFVKGW
jgi:hypothetical protein